MPLYAVSNGGWVCVGQGPASVQLITESVPVEVLVSETASDSSVQDALLSSGCLVREVGAGKVWVRNKSSESATVVVQPYAPLDVGLVDANNGVTDFDAVSTVSNLESGVFPVLLTASKPLLEQDLVGYNAATVTFSSVPGGAKVSFEACADGLTNWVPVAVEPVQGIESEPILCSEVSGVGTWIVPRRARYLRVKASGLVGEGQVLGYMSLIPSEHQFGSIVAAGAASSAGAATGYPVPIAGAVRDFVNPPPGRPFNSGARAEVELSLDGALLQQMTAGNYCGFSSGRIAGSSGLVKSGAGVLYGLHLMNTLEIGVRYLQIYNSADLSFADGNFLATIPLQAGSGVQGGECIGFSNGLAWRLTCDAQGLQPASAGDVVGSLSFK